MSNRSLLLYFYAVRCRLKTVVTFGIFIIMTRLICYRPTSRCRSHMHNFTTVTLRERMRTLDDYVENGMYYFLHDSFDSK